MPDLNSFDVVSQVDMQEVKNAVDQTMKEIRQRFDFKNSKTDLTLKEKEKQLVVLSDDEYKLKAVLEILKVKCVKRNVSLKALTYAPTGGIVAAATTSSGNCSYESSAAKLAIWRVRLSISTSRPPPRSSLPWPSSC